MKFWHREKSDVHTLVGAYVLNALEPDERAAVERHIESCDSCATEVGELTTAAGSLSLPVLSQPNPQVRTHVMSRIRNIRQLPPVPQEHPKRRAKIARAWWRSPQIVTAAMMLFVLFAAVVVTFALQGKDQEPSSGDQIATVLGADDATTSSVTGQNGLTLLVVSSREHDAGVALLEDIPKPPSGYEYQLWWMKPGEVRSAGMAPAGGGSKIMTDMQDAQQVGVTLEPAGGSTQPTTSPLVIVGL